MEAQEYDVVILGGGLAGLTLALQVQQTRPATRILLLEKRQDRAPTATHKVGESTSELGSFYLREVLGLGQYLTKAHIRKLGFRFFFSTQHTGDIARRVEVGSRMDNPFPTHQLDRGILENDLERMLQEQNIHLQLGTKVLDAEVSASGHRIVIQQQQNEEVIKAKWLVDATGRNSFLKRKLGLTKPSDHQINAAWFRVGTEVDVDHWSDNAHWQNLVEPGKRRLATNHLMGNGYWVWIIPLISGCTSIGLVADPRQHPFESFNTYEKTLAWLRKHEPLAADMLASEPLLDFKVMKNFAYESRQFYAADRWALTGEAGAFLDAFYSPGTDFIGLGNTWITDLIVRDLENEDIKLRTMVYEHAHQELLKGWMHIYRNMYSVFGKTQVMLMKIVWDWATYWAIPNLLFMNGGYTNLNVLKQYSSSSLNIGPRFTCLNERMQQLFQQWAPYETDQYEDSHHNVFDLQVLLGFQRDLAQRYEIENLIDKVQANLGVLEQLAAEIFRVASAKVNHTPLNLSVDPYTMALQDGAEMLILKSKSSKALEVEESIKQDVAKFWLRTTPIKQEAYAAEC